MSFKQYLITMPHQITTLGNFYGSFFFFFGVISVTFSSIC